MPALHHLVHEKTEEVRAQHLIPTLRHQIPTRQLLLTHCKEKNMSKLEGRILMAEPPMIAPSAQAVAASGSSKGAPLFVAADRDLVAKQGVAQDSWFVISHLTSGSDRLDLLIHYIRLTPPQGPVIQAMVSVLDPVSGRYLAEEKDYKTSETTFSTASLDVQTPSGGVSGDASAMHVTGRFQRIHVDLTLAQQGPLLANLGTGILPFYGDINYEYALPSMKTSGSVVVDGKPYQVAGVSWFDRQWGQMAPSFGTEKHWS